MLFLMDEKQEDYAECLADDDRRAGLTYFSVIFQHPNVLNSGLQGSADNLLTSSDKFSTV